MSTSAQSINLTKLRKNHAKKWVTLDTKSGEVFTVGKTLREAWSRLSPEQMNRPNIVLHKVLPWGVAFAPWSYEV